MSPPGPQPGGADPDWLHAMRNAANAAAIAAAAVRSALEAGDQARAARFLDEADAACGRMRTLLTPPASRG
ncbi:hypothetical protein [Luteimonas sp. FCS-9]|uniref:hypothetical protein n=1 Tax=Luteimonas sp. FCS-9 TaxID=1547516 RepID=UPI00063EB88C|nr:hypothetical protein [Luteimonas sp. FCS-9]KLJ01320.1 hypothetical protein WQ56_05960 [Luteimonas sp. FCS-9]